MEKYDVVVLGGGPGGYVAAIRAAQLGGNVAIIEKDAFGGTCLNRGCIPTKTYVKNAEIIHSIKNAKGRGIIADDPKVDMTAMRNMKSMVVQQLSNGVKGLLKANRVTVFNGLGKVTGNRTVLIKDDSGEKEIIYSKLIVATGSENNIPSIKGLDEGVLTSTELLDLTDIPESLIIIGGGVIGCEFATVYEALGTKVTVVEMMPRLIANLDADLSAQLQKNLKKKKVNVLVEHSVTELEKTEHGYKVKMKNQKNNEDDEIEAEKVLISVGRKPNIEGLEALNLEMNRRFIKVNEKMETSNPDVYAVGDVNGIVQLAHVASAQGRVAAENALGQDNVCNTSVVPSCIYTIPEIGSVGLSEIAAREKYENVTVGKFPAAALGKALAMGETEGSYKIVIDEDTKKILGVHIFGANATELIMEAAVAMQNGGELSMITDTIHAHPTMAEGLMEATHAAEGFCIHMPPVKN